MARVYVGNLPIDIRERELDDLFYKYGRIREIDLKQPARPPAFAFIAFDDVRDAEDAVRGRHGYNFDGQRLRCEIAKGERGGGRGGGFSDRREERPRGGGGARRSDYGVIVTNLPKSCSWQDLKDYMRKAGDVVFSDVSHSTGEGVVEFSNREDMENAIRKLDDTEFKNHSDSAYIRVKAARGGREDSRDRKEPASSKRKDDSRSRSRSRSRSADRDDRRTRDRSSSRSRSPSSDRDDDKDRKKDKKEEARGRSDSRTEEDVKKRSDKDEEESSEEKKEDKVAVDDEDN